MQIRKEILLFFTLVLLCITLITAAGLSKEPTVNCSVPAKTAPPKCCKKYIQQNNTSPWDFITQGILHLAA